MTLLTDKVVSQSKNNRRKGGKNNLDLRFQLHFPQGQALHIDVDVTRGSSFRLNCNGPMTQFIRMKAVFFRSTVTSSQKPRDAVSRFPLPPRLTVFRRTGRHGGRPTHADDLAGSEGGWGVPVQHIRQTGELGVGELSNKAEAENQLNKD